MPIEYSFDAEKALICTKVSGDLTTEATLAYFGDLGSDPGCPESAIELVDFSEVTDFSLKYAQMHGITQQYQPTKNTKRIVATVFYCPTDLSFGIARMLHSFHEMANPEHVVRLTRTEEELERVLEQLRAEHAV